MEKGEPKLLNLHSLTDTHALGRGSAREKNIHTCENVTIYKRICQKGHGHTHAHMEMAKDSHWRWP